MTEKRYESISQKLLHQLLAQKFDSIQWEKELNDPPDYWLSLGSNKKYAVEVTSSKVSRKTVDNVEIIEETFVNTVYKIAETIETEALRDNLLKGTYTIYVKHPIPAKGFRKHIKDIREFLFDFIKETSDSCEVASRSYKIKELVIVTISKFNNIRNEIYGIPGIKTVWSNSPANDKLVLDMLQYAIDSKMNRLKNIKEPKILIYYDTYILSTKENYLKCVAKLNNKKFFDSIFVILGGKNIIKIHSDLLPGY